MNYYLKSAAGAAAPSAAGSGSVVNGRKPASRKGSSVAVKKVPLNEEVFRTDEDRHTKWSNVAAIIGVFHFLWALKIECTQDCLNLAKLINISGNEIKKELGAISGLLVDLPQDDDLQSDLRKAHHRLQKLAIRLLA